jgi:hypothetical protein
VVTAARLSATFPYVSPICRDDQNIQTNHHMADGGYFDNSGFVTAVEWLTDVIKKTASTNQIKRVLILQINPFPKEPLPPATETNRGLSMAILGPLLTLFKVRDPILNARNFTEVELLQQKWKSVSQICEEQAIDIQYFPIFFPSQKGVTNYDYYLLKIAKFLNENYSKLLSIYFLSLIEQNLKEFYNQQGEYRPPLSWKLTQKGKKAIERGWKFIAKRKDIQDLKHLWKRKWGM